MKIGVILFRIFQSGIRYPGGLEQENCEIENFLLYYGEKNITCILIKYSIMELVKRKIDVKLNSFS